jgi:hypothetical protein
MRAWKGAGRDRVTVVTGDEGEVAFPFQMTASYVVWAVADLPAKRWLVRRCGRTRPVTQSVPDDRAALDAWAELAPVDIPPSAPALICCCGVEIRSATDDLLHYDAVFIGDVVESRSCSKTWGFSSMRGATAARMSHCLCDESSGDRLTPRRPCEPAGAQGIR